MKDKIDREMKQGDYCLKGSRGSGSLEFLIVVNPKNRQVINEHSQGISRIQRPSWCFIVDAAQVPEKVRDSLMLQLENAIVLGTIPELRV